jgi:hypothetical protein
VTPYAYRIACAAIGAMRLPPTARFHEIPWHDAAYCIDAPEFMPGGAHEVLDPARAPNGQRAVQTLAVRDL